MTETVLLCDPRKIAFGEHFRGVQIPTDQDGIYEPKVNVDDILPSICKKGILKPIHIWKDPSLDGTEFEYRLTDGMRRLTAVRHAMRLGSLPQDTLVPAILDDDVHTQDDAVVRGGLLNLGHRQLNRIEVGERLSRLMAAGWSLERLATSFSITEKTARAYILLSRKISGTLRAAVEREQLTIDEAKVFYDMPDDRREVELYNLLLARLTNSEDAQEMWHKLQRDAGLLKPMTPGQMRTLLPELSSFVELHKEQEEWAPFVEQALQSRNVVELILRQRADKTQVLYGFKESDVTGKQS